MYEVVLIEDEPAAMRYLRSIIDGKCEGFKVVGEAENGQQGLSLIRELKPDLVITDIKMAMMSGIEVVTQLKREYPWIRSIIVSGYQDFEYAKKALQSGVVDYLLKPVSPSQLKSLMEDISEKLAEEYRINRYQLIKSILSGMEVEPWFMNKYLTESSYCTAIFRVNGLPSRFLKTSRESEGGLYTKAGSILKAGQQPIVLIEGRDEHEILLFYPGMLQYQQFVKEFIKELGSNIMGYCTSLTTSTSIKLGELKSRMPSLYRMLDQQIRIGCSQALNYEQLKKTPEKYAKTDEDFSKKLSYLLSSGEFQEAKTEIEKQLRIYEKSEYTFIMVESQLRSIFKQLEKSMPFQKMEEYEDLEFMLQEAILNSENYTDLINNINDMLVRLMNHADKKNRKVDTEEFIVSILDYTEQNMNQPLTLQSVCSIFGISQTYFSRLLRKYKEMSFNEYLTAIRIEKAKQLITSNPKLPLKEISLMVGYNDPFYFSRVFRSITGVPPSDYHSIE